MISKKMIPYILAWLCTVVGASVALWLAYKKQETDKKAAAISDLSADQLRFLYGMQSDEPTRHQLMAERAKKMALDMPRDMDISQSLLTDLPLARERFQNAEEKAETAAQLRANEFEMKWGHLIMFVFHEFDKLTGKVASQLDQVGSTPNPMPIARAGGTGRGNEICVARNGENCLNFAYDSPMVTAASSGYAALALCFRRPNQDVIQPLRLTIDPENGKAPVTLDMGDGAHPVELVDGDFSLATKQEIRKVIGDYLRQLLVISPPKK